MDIMTMLPNALIVIAVVLISAFMCKFIYEKWNETKYDIKNEKIRNAIDTVVDVVYCTVAATNQTLVESLKKQGAFDIEAAHKAFNTTKCTVINILSKEVIDIVTSAVGDFNTYLDTLIESTVNEQKA